jgi:hypothetical protein
MGRKLIAAWGVLGVLALLAQALVRLTPMALEALRGELTGLQWGVLAGWVVVSAHAEGYRGFHRRFSPRVVARARHLATAPAGRVGVASLVLAPLYCMSLFGASRRGVLVARSIVVGVVILVVLVRMLDQPWRGIIDAGVVVGLGLGALSIVYFAVRAIGGTPPPIDPDLDTPMSADAD